MNLFLFLTTIASSELSRFQSRLEDLRKWSLSTYKCTRQIISEKLGKGSRTVDPELEAQIEVGGRERER